MSTILDLLKWWQYSIKMNFEFLSGSLNYSVRPEWHKQRQLRLTYHTLLLPDVFKKSNVFLKLHFTLVNQSVTPSFEMRSFKSYELVYI